MILILSDARSTSVNKVISYIKVCSVKRFNDIFPERLIPKFQNNNSSLNENQDEIIKIWYYRSYLKFNHFESNDYISITENNLFREYFLHFRNKKIIGSYKDFFFQNTLIQLFEAEKTGHEIPKTVISTSFPDFGKSKVVNKIIGNAKSFSTPNYIYTTTGTQFVNKEEFIENGHLNFFQEYIEKEFEIRIFYFLGKFFAMAIFSQQDPMTLVDYRNYNDNKPNRNIPIKLPMEIQKKLKRLMKKLDLNTGSIDMIYSKTGQYVFLEVNPCGIFEWLSSNCNYYIEKYIAKALENGQ